MKVSHQVLKRMLSTGELDVKVSKLFSCSKRMSSGKLSLLCCAYTDIFCAGCQKYDNNDGSMYIGINLDVKATADINFDPYYSPYMTDIRSSAFINVFPEMWTESESCGWTTGALGENVFNFREYRGEERKFGFYKISDSQGSCLNLYTPQTSGSCVCSGDVSPIDGTGGPDCTSFSSGARFCYTEAGACTDGASSSHVVGKEWSRLACQF